MRIKAPGGPPTAIQMACAASSAIPVTRPLDCRPVSRRGGTARRRSGTSCGRCRPRAGQLGLRTVPSLAIPEVPGRCEGTRRYTADARQRTLPTDPDTASRDASIDTDPVYTALRQPSTRRPLCRRTGQRPGPSSPRGSLRDLWSRRLHGRSTDPWCCRSGRWSPANPIEAAVAGAHPQRAVGIPYITVTQSPLPSPGVSNDRNRSFASRCSPEAPPLLAMPAQRVPSRDTASAKIPRPALSFQALCGYSVSSRFPSAAGRVRRPRCCLVRPRPVSRRSETRERLRHS